MQHSIDRLVCRVAAHFAEGVFQHGILLIEVVDRLLSYPIIVHRTLHEETQEALDTVTACTGGEIDEQTEVETQGSCQDGVATEEVDLDLHGIAHPTEDVDIVPALFVVLSRRIVVDAHLVVVIAVQLGLRLGIQDGLQGGELRDFLRVEVLRFVEHESVAVAPS